MLTIAKLRQWSVRYYNDTSRAAQNAAMDRRSANGGLGSTTPRGDPRCGVDGRRERRCGGRAGGVER